MVNLTKQVFVIADYGRSDPAFVEVYQRISNLVPDAAVENLNVQSLSTLQTGFWAYQLALNHSELQSPELRELLRGGKPRKTYLFLNTAPRRDHKGPRTDNEGEGLAYARLSNGIEVVGVLSGTSFSFLKPMIEELRLIDIPSKGSQFRSRDIFPLALAKIASGDYSQLGEKVDLDDVPDPKPNSIAHVDGYGNMKLSIKRSDLDLSPGDVVTIRIGAASHRATYTEGIFGVPEGTLCLAPGSSGPKDDGFLEVSKRGGNAWREFGKPAMEAELKISSSRRNVVLR